MKLTIFLFLLLSGCTATEIPVITQNMKESPSYVTTIETGHIPSAFNPHFNDYQLKEDGYLHIDVYHDDWSVDVHLMNPKTLEIQFNAKHKEPIKSESFLKIETSDFSIVQKHKDELSPLEYYFVNDDQTKLIFSEAQIPDSLDALNYHPYYDKYSQKVYLAYPENEQCVIYELQDSGERIELDHADLILNDLSLTDFDARTKTFIYRNHDCIEFHSNQRIYKAKNLDQYEIVGDYLLIIPYHVDEDARFIHLKTGKERTIDKYVLPYQNHSKPDWMVENGKLSFVNYSIRYQQFIHGLYDGKDMIITLLGFDETTRIIQLSTHTALQIINENKHEHLYLIDIN